MDALRPQTECEDGEEACNVCVKERAVTQA